MRQIGNYDIDDPAKIQGRDDVMVDDHSLAALRLRAGLAAISGCSGRVLVLGCGAGRYVRAIQRERPDLDVHGGDLSLTALREARRRAPAGYVALDASALPYRDRSFSAVLFFDLLEHVPAAEAMVQEIARILVPTGVLHFFVPLEGKPDTLYGLLRHSERLPIHRWKRDHVGHVHQFTGADVLRAVWAAGLTVTDVHYGFHIVGQIHDVIDYWQRERTRGGPGVVPPDAVRWIARIAFIPTWRLSYVEDRLYTGRRFGSGLYVTAVKPADATIGRRAGTGSMRVVGD